MTAAKQEARKAPEVIPDFMAARVKRVCRIAGVPWPETFTDVEICEVAPSLLGQCASSLERRLALVRVALAAAFEDREGWRVKIAEALRATGDVPNSNEPQERGNG